MHLTNITQYSLSTYIPKSLRDLGILEKSSKTLVCNLIDADIMYSMPNELVWNLDNGYSLVLKMIHISGDRAWFELQKNRKTVGSFVLIEGGQFTFKNEELNATILTGKLDYLYRDPWSASLSNVTEYSENGKILEFFRKVTLTEGDILGDTQVKVISSKPSFEILFTLINKVLGFRF